jgi:predicted dehydrogenase
LDAVDPLPASELRQIPDSIFGRAFAIFAAHLVRGVAESGERPWQDGPLGDAATFRDGLAVQRVLDALRLSHRQQRWVEVATTD